MLNLASYAQVRHVKGTVWDADDGTPIPGVNVMINASDNGVTTDANGNYSITVNSKNTVLLFSFIGYKSQTATVNNNKIINIKLRPDTEKLDEVVVLGYGTVKSKEAIVGSVEQVTSDILETQKSVESVDKMLEGQIAGVVVESDGDPGAPVKISIRGQNSLSASGNDVSASSQPLYILDGIPLVDLNESKTLSATDMEVNPLSFINPDDIETITVLKDASSAAIYGANAANGVVLITTKKGKKGRTRVTLTHKETFQESINLMKYLNTDQYIELVKESYENDGKTYDDYKSLVENPDTYTDWSDVVLRTGRISNTGVSVSGGNEFSTFRLSLNRSRTKTITKGNDFSTNSANINYSVNLFKNWKLKYSGNFSQSRKDVSVLGGQLDYRPNLPLYNDDGTYYQFPNGYLGNPLAVLEQNQNWSKVFSTTNNINLSVRFLKYFKWSTTAGADYTNKRGFVYMSSKNSTGRKNNGYLKETRKNDFNWTAFSQISYDREFNNFGVQALVGSQISENNNNYVYTLDKNLLTDKILMPGAGAEDSRDHKGSENTTSSRSFYGRFSFDYAKKYFVSVNLRSDESSYFGGDSKKEVFSSAGFSWLLSKESFLKDNRVLSGVKLKTSFGKTGNAKVGSYSARGLYRYSQTASYNGSLIAEPSTAPNPDLGWQKTYKFNTGLNFTLFNLFDFEFEYYRNSVQDAIKSIQVIPESGYNSIPVNAVDMVNYGIEATVKLKKLNIGKVMISSSLNMAYNTNEITRIDDRVNLVNLYEGESSTIIRGYKFMGVDPQTGLTKWMLGDGTITTDLSMLDYKKDRYIIGDSSPDLTGGGNLSVSYSGLRLSTSISFQSGGDRMLSYKYRSSLRSDQMYIKNMSINLLDRWQKPGDVTDVPKLTTSRTSVYTSNNNQFMYDMSNIALRNISLDYTIPGNIVEKAGLSNIKIGMAVSNIYTWYRSGNDSDRNGVAEYRYAFPKTRNYTFNVSLTY